MAPSAATSAATRRRPRSWRRSAPPPPPWRTACAKRPQSSVDMAPYSAMRRERRHVDQNPESSVPALAIRPAAIISSTEGTSTREAARALDAGGKRRQLAAGDASAQGAQGGAERQPAGELGHGQPQLLGQRSLPRSRHLLHAGRPARAPA